MVELNAIPNVSLKLIFAIHFILITWSTQGYWCPMSYAFYNFLFLVTLLWGMNRKDSEEPLHIAIFLNSISIFLDIFTLLFFYNHESGHASDSFSLLVMIMHLVFRPVSVLLMSKICAERMGISGGVFPGRFGDIFGSFLTDVPGQRSSYEDIDSAPSTLPHRNPQPHHQSVPETIYQQP